MEGGGGCQNPEKERAQAAGICAGSPFHSLSSSAFDSGLVLWFSLSGSVCLGRSGLAQTPFHLGPCAGALAHLMAAHQSIGAHTHMPYYYV